VLEDVDALLLGEAEGLHGGHRTPRPLMLGARPRRTHPSLFFLPDSTGVDRRGSVGAYCWHRHC
jgi:hypothetical protein